jgi:DNA-binding transcriptional MerR regulator
MTVPAVRFYEQAGLLPKPAHTGSGYRVSEEMNKEDMSKVVVYSQPG